MHTRQHIYFVLLTFMVIACILPMQAITPRLRASLITCYPGPEIYELVGHEAIRIQGYDASGAVVDSVWNYGVFDFNTPNFVYRFVKGETDYMVWGYPFEWFMPQYIERGSKVVEQPLNFSPEETQRLRHLLQINALPANRTYRYNYVRDNCSTRIAAMLDSAVAPRRIIYPDSVAFTSFRNAMRHYHRNYPWYQFGIDLALGSGIDAPLNSRQEIFSPLRFMELAENAHFAGGGKLTSPPEVLYAGSSDPVLPPTPWYLTPLFFATLLMCANIGIGLWQWFKGRIVRWWMTIFFSLLGFAGCVVWFLVFVSTHDSTAPNLMFLWLTPLQFVPAICIWWRHTRPLAQAMVIVDLIVLVIMTALWPFQPQSANPAVFPLWGATLALCASYALVYPRLDRRIYTPDEIHPPKGTKRKKSKR